MGELTDAEFWLLLSLDAEARLFELLMAITQHMDGEERQIRPSLSIPEAAQALASLAARGLVEFREERSDAGNPDEWRLVPQDRVQAIVSEPANWEVPTDDGKVSYWAAATDEGEAAYRRASEARGGAWVEEPGPSRLLLRRGVAEYVNDRGGKLYLWGQPAGSFGWARASTKPPDDREFVTSSATTAFELYVEQDLPRYLPVQVARRWWGLRDGLVVSTGFYRDRSRDPE